LKDLKEHKKDLKEIRVDLKNLDKKITDYFKKSINLRLVDLDKELQTAFNRLELLSNDKNSTCGKYYYWETTSTLMSRAINYPYDFALMPCSIGAAVEQLKCFSSIESLDNAVFALPQMLKSIDISNAQLENPLQEVILLKAVQPQISEQINLLPHPEGLLEGVDIYASSRFGFPEKQFQSLAYLRWAIQLSKSTQVIKDNVNKLTEKGTFDQCRQVYVDELENIIVKVIGDEIDDFILGFFGHDEQPGVEYDYLKILLRGYDPLIVHMRNYSSYDTNAIYRFIEHHASPFIFNSQNDCLILNSQNDCHSYLSNYYMNYGELNPFSELKRIDFFPLKLRSNYTDVDGYTQYCFESPFSRDYLLYKTDITFPEGHYAHKRGVTNIYPCTAASDHAMRVDLASECLPKQKRISFKYIYKLKDFSELAFPMFNDTSDFPVKWEHVNLNNTFVDYPDQYITHAHFLYYLLNAGIYMVRSGQNNVSDINLVHRVIHRLKTELEEGNPHVIRFLTAAKCMSTISTFQASRLTPVKSNESNMHDCQKTDLLLSLNDLFSVYTQTSRKRFRKNSGVVIDEQNSTIIDTFDDPGFDGFIDAIRYDLHVKANATAQCLAEPFSSNNTVDLDQMVPLYDLAELAIKSLVAYETLMKKELEQSGTCEDGVCKGEDTTSAETPPHINAATDKTVYANGPGYGEGLIHRDGLTVIPHRFKPNSRDGISFRIVRKISFWVRTVSGDASVEAQHESATLATSMPLTIKNNSKGLAIHHHRLALQLHRLLLIPSRDTRELPLFVDVV